MTTRIISVRISEVAIAQADDLATHHGLSRSKLVEYLLEQAHQNDQLRRSVDHIQKLATRRFIRNKGED